MSETWVSKPKHVDVVAWAPFNRLTGAASNIDAVVAESGVDAVRYVGGDLQVANQTAETDDFVGEDGVGNPVHKTPGEIETQYTED
jgi:hypothetical protein